jgi:MoxR-like ATPase
MTKRPLAKINCQMLTEASQLYGFRDADPITGTHYVPSAFTQAIQTPNSIVLLDDIAHVHDRTITNGLLPALDFTRIVEIDYLQMYIKVAAGVIIIGTGNQGYKYSGANKLDHALVSRFENRIYIKPHSDDVIRQIIRDRTGLDPISANRLIKLFQKLRSDPKSQIEVDMRGLLAAASDMHLGASFYEAVTYTLLGDLDPQQQEAVKAIVHVEMDEAEVTDASRSGGYTVWA